MASNTYSAPNFIGLPLIAAMDGVKIYTNLISGETAHLGTFRKGDNMGKVVSYITKGKGTYATYLESGFQVEGNLPNGGRGTFFVPLRKGYFDELTMRSWGLQSDEEIKVLAEQKTQDALGAIGSLQLKLTQLGTLVEQVALYGIVAVVSYGAFQLVKLIRGK